MTISSAALATPLLDMRMRSIALLAKNETAAPKNTEDTMKPKEKVFEKSLIDNWPGARFPRLYNTTRPDQHSSLPSTKTDQNLRFYERQQAPWIGPDQRAEDIPEVILEQSRAYYLKDVIDVSLLSLNHMFDDYHDFRQQLSFINPELSTKHFGFTLGPDQQIKITDPDNVLTAAESGYLTEKLNERERLKENLYTHAKTVMELVDHLTEMFADKYSVTLENYHKVIDYGQIFTRNTIGNFMDTWAWQVHRYADKREDTDHDSPSRIDVNV